nr:PREDICTED: ficolin-2-like [Opisthocomus hoazin]
MRDALLDVGSRSLNLCHEEDICPAGAEPVPKLQLPPPREPLLLPAPHGSACPGPSSAGAGGLPGDPGGDGPGLQAVRRQRCGDLVLLPAVVGMLLLCVSAGPAVPTTSSRSGFPADCSHLRKNSPSGVYVIQPAKSPPRVVWCDMDTEGKGWTVVQRNSHDTELTWKQSWTTYKYGFGNVQGDHWLGTEYLHLLTQQGTYKVRFVVRNKLS